MMLRRLRCGVALVWLGALMLMPLSARAEEPKSAQDDRAASFEAVTGPVKEDVAGGPLMLAAYAVVWLAIFGYGFRLVRLHRSIEDNLSRVERAVLAAGSKDAV